ncbi:formin-like protein 5 [Triticum aestivum]|uniref:formin-like protein 5 n=1 Tax=Triticum aestivum TaxID=4565 RepID=UPI001D031C02|nr:formin-like protein 5 [Triticum aestivum]
MEMSHPSNPPPPPLFFSHLGIPFAPTTHYLSIPTQPTTETTTTSSHLRILPDHHRQTHTPRRSPLLFASQPLQQGACQAPWPPKELHRLTESTPPSLPCIKVAIPAGPAGRQVQRHGHLLCPIPPLSRLRRAPPLPRASAVTSTGAAGPPARPLHPPHAPAALAFSLLPLFRSASLINSLSPCPCLKQEHQPVPPSSEMGSRRPNPTWPVSSASFPPPGHRAAHKRPPALSAKSLPPLHPLQRAGARPMPPRLPDPIGHQIRPSPMHTRRFPSTPSPEPPRRLRRPEPVAAGFLQNEKSSSPPRSTGLTAPPRAWAASSSFVDRGPVPTSTDLGLWPMVSSTRAPMQCWAGLCFGP